MQETTVQGFRLSPQQLRLWKLLGGEASTAWRWRALLRLEGDLDRTALEGALRRVTERNEILRTSFSRLPGMSLPLQVIQETTTPWIEEGTDALGPGFTPLFDPAGGETLRVRLARLGDRRHELLLDLPALCADAVTLENLAAEILHTCAREESEPPLQYVDIAEWQNQILEAEETADGAALWRELWHERGIAAQLALRLPFEEGPADAPFDPATLAVPLEPALAGALVDLAKRQGVPPETVVLAIWQILLWKSTGRPEVLLGLLHHGRNHAELREALGPLARYLPLHVHLDPEMRLADLLALTRTAVDEADLRQEHFSWDHVAGDASTVPLFFPVCFETSPGLREIAADGLRGSVVWRQGLVDRFKLSLACEILPGDFRLALRHDRGLISAETAGRLAERLSHLLHQAMERPQAFLGELDPLGETERRQLNRLGRSPLPAAAEDCLHHAFERQARRTPDRPAVVWNGEEVTFRELDRRANQLAHHLRALGAGPEVLVALCLDRSADAVAAVLGILKSGAAYVPLDPTHPRERLELILGNTGAPLLVSERRLAAALPSEGVRTVLLDEEAEAIAAWPASPPISGALPRSLAYAIYTSGSTGMPKGVLIEHRSPLNLLAGLEAAALSERRGPLRASLNAPLIFDASMQQIVLLLAGHTLCVVPEEVRTDGAALLAFMRGERLDLFDCTPSQLRILLAAGLLNGPAPEIVLTAGEAIDLGMWKSLARAERTAFYNIYGPTEATVDATWHRVGSAPDGPTIGRPLAGYEVHVLDGGLDRVPIGAPGELCIGGPGLARGYAGRPELTADRFRPHPFGPLPGERLYRTGDLGRHRPDGELEFLGRTDHQVKIRGYRIELGEIETALAAHPWVLEAVADVRMSPAGDPVLAAWVRLRSEAPGALSTLRPELQEHLRARIPPYMVPTAFGVVETLPVTPSGKVSRQALPDPGLGRSTADYVPPRNPVEQLLAAVWEEVLGTGPVGIHDDFFDLGGHSLLATKVISRVRNALHLELPVRLVFEGPTVAELAAAVGSVARTDAPPLVPVPRDGELPLSFAQQRLWFLQQLEPGSASYNTPFAVRLAGRLHVPALAAAVNGLVRRHEVLRTTFVVEEGRPRQVIAPPAEQLLPVTDLTALAAPLAEREARRLAAEEASAPFDLSRPPVFRIRLLRLGEDDHVLLLTFHHVRGDGWSVGVLAREISEIYTAAVAGRAPRLPTLPVQYADYARWQRDWLQGPVLEAQLRYWRSRLTGAPEVLELPTDHPRPPVPAFRGGREERALSAALTEALDQLGRQHGTTPFMTLLAGFAALLHRYTDQGSVVVGSPIAQRTRAEIEGLIGFFANTLPMRLDLGDDPSFGELLGRARETALGAYAHQDLPFEKLVEELRPERDLSHAPIFQVMLVFQSQPAEPLRLGDLETLPFGEGAVSARFDLTLSCSEHLGRLVCVLDYDADLFEAATASRMLRLFEHLLEGAAAQPATPVSALPLLDEEELRQVLAAWTAPPPDLPAGATLHLLFEERAARAPEAPALLSGEETVTYAELDRQANRLARRLLRIGAGPESRVGLCLDRSPAAIAAMLGILKVGGAYVPLDPEWPGERLAALARDAGLAALVTEGRLLRNLAGLAPRTVVPDTDLAAESGDAVAPRGTPESAAYVIYTSGSTGSAKGVVVSHGAVTNFVQGLAGALDLSPADRLLLFAPLSFDASVLQIFPPLASGGSLVIHPNPRELAGSDLLGFCERYGVTVLDLPAALWRRWVEEVATRRTPPPAGLRAFLTGGESVPVEKLREWARWVRRPASLLSSYGPTEATVTATVFQTTSGAAEALPPGNLPLGRPLPGVRIRLLDRRMRAVPRGVPGEIHLAGAGLARGYLGRPELTAEAFRPDPFSAEPGGRLYRTGDLARQRPDGGLEFLGRADHQVKIRGFRLELAEVEAVLGQHPALADCVVTVREDRPGDRRLVAYAVPQPGRVPGVPELRSFVAERLPHYMVPSAFVMLPTLPVLASGKVDRAALPAPESDRPELGSSYAKPRTPAEATLAAVWARVLRLDQVGVHDNFFDLGGDSILSIQIIARASQAGLRLTARQIFEHQTVAELARVADSTGAIDATQGTVTGEAPLLPIQRWFFEEGFADPHHFNQAVMLEVREPIAPGVLERAAAALLEHHDALRLLYPSDAGGRRQVHAEAPAPCSRIDLSGLPAERRPPAVLDAAEQVQTGFDLERGPLTRLVHFAPDPRENGRLLWVTHHLVVDGVSWRVLLEDLETAVRLSSRGEAMTLPPKSTSFQTWGERLTAHARSGALAGEREVWLAAARAPIPPLPVDVPAGRRAATVGSARAVSVALSSDETRDLLQTVPAAFRTQINDALLCALARALAPWTGSRKLRVDLEGHGREPLFDDVDLSRTVGWFTTQFPVTIDPGPASDPGAALAAVKEQLRRIPGRGIGYGLLRHTGADPDLARELREAPRAEISFNYLGQLDQVGDAGAGGSPLFRLVGEPTGSPRSPRSHLTHLLEVSGHVAGGRLVLTLGYSERVHRRSTIERLAEALSDALRELIAGARGGSGAAVIPSDFPLAELDADSLLKVALLLDHED